MGNEPLEPHEGFILYMHFEECKRNAYAQNDPDMVDYYRVRQEEISKRVKLYARQTTIR